MNRLKRFYRPNPFAGVGPRLGPAVCHPSRRAALGTAPVAPRPAPEEDRTEVLPLPQADDSSRDRPVVLVADDDGFVRHMLEVVLHVAGFETVAACTGRDALNQFLRHPRAVAVALLDVGLPGGSGPQTLTALRRFDPRLPCCFMTGDPSPYTVSDLMAVGAESVFWKPLSIGEVAATLRRLTGAVGGPPA